MRAAGRERQADVYLGTIRGRRSRVPFAPAKLEEQARLLLPPEAFAYIAGGAGAELTMRANRAAFARRRIVPRVLRDVSQRDLAVEILGRRLAAPLLLAPIGVLEVAHRDADLAVARAAAAYGVPFVLSSQASVPIETCAEAMGDAPRWFQLYWSTSNELVESFVRRAERCGCEALVVTLDTTMLGWRCRDLDLGYLPFLYGKGIAQYTSDPVFQALLDEAGEAPAPGGKLTATAVRALVATSRAYPGSLLRNLRSRRPRDAVRTFIEIYSRPSLTWDDLSFLRGLTTMPLVLKGVLHAEDAVRAVDRGVDAVWVSNHGGRQVDGAIASLDALPAIASAVAGRVPVLLDSGIRGGADVVKALALGATAVCLGRPYAYGLAIGGEQGVAEVIANVQAELDLTLGLSGFASLAELTPDVIA
jgi:isopentenyl diphosphate isomerase/L-lactate dehydrogenase-like FMN-dependent dehydrogenase